jgi:hypothetical protein
MSLFWTIVAALIFVGFVLPLALSILLGIVSLIFQAFFDEVQEGRKP